MQDAASLLEEALDAHGGRARWEGLAEVRMSVVLRGPALLLKGRSPFARRYDMRAFTDGVRGELTGVGKGFARFSGDRVELVDEHGAVAATETPARRGTGALRPRLRWRDEGLAYFLCYAFWNYALTPWLLTWPGVEAERIADAVDRGERCRRLRVRFPSSIPTHSPTQVFWFGSDGLQRRLDYTATYLSRWARGAHQLLEYERFDGVPVAARRRVLLRPTSGTFALPFAPALTGVVESVRFVPRM